MCFNSSKPQVSKIAEKNLTVFKVMRKTYGGVILCSPYRHSEYKINELHTAPTSSLKNAGGFYSFKIFKNAKDWLRSFNKIHGIRTLRIYKCVIPKGSRYIEGFQDIDFSSRKSIRSKQIIFKELIKK